MASFIVDAAPQNSEPPAGSVPYGVLKRTHDDYDADLFHRLDLLARGGYAIKKEAHVFIPRVPREDKDGYKWRCKVTGYVNLLSRVVGYLAGTLFEAPLEVQAQDADGSAATLPDKAFYSEFFKNCDLKGTGFSQFMKERLTSALIFKRAIIGIDLPRVEQSVVNRAQEDALGAARAYLYSIPVEQLINWEVREAGESDAPTSRFGDFEECMLRRRLSDRRGLLSGGGKHAYEFKHWQVLNGVAHYSVYRTKFVKEDAELSDEEPVELVVEPTPTSFKQIPVMSLELPEQVWAGDQAGPLCEEHYAHRANLVGTLGRTMVEFAVVKRGSEMGAPLGLLPSETQQNPRRASDPIGEARANGAVPVGADDSIEFVGPSGRAAEMIRTEVSILREEILGTVHTMALNISNSAAALSRSGESKKEDRDSTSVVCDLLGEIVREDAANIAKCVSEARGEKATWAATGVDSYDAEDRGAVVEEATDVAMLQIKSPTFRRYYDTQTAHALVRKASSEVKRAIKEEIEKNVTDEDVLNPPIPGAPGERPGGPSSAAAGDKGPPKPNPKPAKAGANEEK